MTGKVSLLLLTISYSPFSFSKKPMIELQIKLKGKKSSHFFAPNFFLKRNPVT